MNCMERDGRPCEHCRDGQGGGNANTAAIHRAAIRIIDDPEAAPEARARVVRYFGRVAASNHDGDEGSP